MKNERKVVIFITILIVCLASYIGLTYYQECNNEETSDFRVDETEEEGVEIHLDLNIEDYYITNTGDPSNLYFIDEHNVLWGCGRNNCGQLGTGTQDYDFHSDMVKIAEHVVHVDYSQKDFMIYLTEDNQLYGVGNAGCGALQQYDELNRDMYVNDEQFYISTPYLLMENVIYARCGQSDVVCIKDDNSAWMWGAIGYSYFEPDPVKVLENVVLVTGGWYNHAALLEDGTVWTWGYNYTGNCGVADTSIVSKPTMVAEDVLMVWTGNMEKNVGCYDISEFRGEYPRAMENTVIKKADGSYWICGANVGTEEKIIPYYYEDTDYSIICTHVFQPYDLEEDND